MKADVLMKSRDLIPGTTSSSPDTMKSLPFRFRYHAAKERFKSIVYYNHKRLQLDLKLIRAFNEMSDIVIDEL